MKLGRRQREILVFLRDFKDKQGDFPSVAEICAGLNLKSKGTVFYHLKKLEAEGLIEKDAMGAIYEVKGPEKVMGVTSIPLYGAIAASPPSEAYAQDEVITVPDMFLGKGEDLFALEVRGDSMIEEGIRDGDLVFLRRQHTARHGQIVAARINGEMTLKKFFNRDGRIAFLPANREMQPIEVSHLDDVDILGILTGNFQRR